MDDNFLKLTITETFGIREGIINLVSTFSFLIKAKIRGVMNQLPNSLYIAAPGHLTTAEREDIDDPDPTKEGSGLINLYFDAVIDGNGDKQALSIIKKRDVEYKKTKTVADAGKAECVLNLVKG